MNENDKLYETGCALCGKPTQWRLGLDTDGVPVPTANRQNPGSYLCTGCGGYEPRVSKADAEITRRKSLARVAPVAAEQPEFKVGDRVSGEGYCRFVPEHGRLYIGDLIELRGEYATVRGVAELMPNDICNWAVKHSTLRHIDSAAAPSPLPRPANPKRDPYATHRTKLSAKLGIPEGGLLDGAAAAATAQIQLKRLDRMTRAERMRAQALLDFGRPVVKKTAHPSNWPEQFSSSSWEE